MTLVNIESTLQIFWLPSAAFYQPFQPALSTSFSSVRLFRRIAGLRKDYAFLYGNFTLGERATAENRGVISILRYPDVIKANRFMFAGNFHPRNETTVDLYKELGTKAADATVLAMTTNMVHREVHQIRGNIDPTIVTLKSGEGILIKMKDN